MTPTICPSCRRPVAVPRPQCLYCGAALPAVAPSAPSPAATTEPTTGDGRSLVIVDVGGEDPGRIAAGLAISRFEATQRLRRGGLDLWRIAATAAAEEAGAALRATGLKVMLLPEAEVRDGMRAEAVSGGRMSDGALHLRVDGGTVRAAAGAALLVVQGPIAREYAPSPGSLRVRLATLESGYRIHLHRHGVPRPLELDPDAFDFGRAGVPRSSLLTLREWVHEIAAGTPTDDSFRRIPPALAPAKSRDSQTEALAARSRRDGARKGDTAVALDNLDQFRFHSAWRAAAERRRARPARQTSRHAAAPANPSGSPSVTVPKFRSFRRRQMYASTMKWWILMVATTSKTLSTGPKPRSTKA
ncbi:MAG: hypothetical protein ACHQNV_02325 [Vicinamibacteria bacterium]